MKKVLKDFSSAFPEPEYGRGYWHLHLPTSNLFIDSPKTPVKIRRQSIQLLINCVEHLINIKPQTNIPIRVVATINLPSLWDSQIIIFWGEEYFSNFFDRNTENQKWTPLSEKRDILKEWDLNIPQPLKVKGYHEEILDEDASYTGEIWFIGEL